jgi:hypothetical protein
MGAAGGNRRVGIQHCKCLDARVGVPLGINVHVSTTAKARCSRMPPDGTCITAHVHRLLGVRLRLPMCRCWRACTRLGCRSVLSSRLLPPIAHNRNGPLTIPKAVKGLQGEEQRSIPALAACHPSQYLVTATSRDAAANHSAYYMSCTHYGCLLTLSTSEPHACCHVGRYAMMVVPLVAPQYLKRFSTWRHLAYVKHQPPVQVFCTRAVTASHCTHKRGTEVDTALRWQWSPVPSSELQATAQTSAAPSCSRRSTSLPGD